MLYLNQSILIFAKNPIFAYKYIKERKKSIIDMRHKPRHLAADYTAAEKERRSRL